jgi:hypothetical protein
VDDGSRSVSSGATVLASAAGGGVPSPPWGALARGFRAAVSSGFLEGSKLMILILGRRISGGDDVVAAAAESASMALAVRFRFRGVDDDEVGEDDDIADRISRQ